MDQWGSHIHALAAAVHHTGGAILELGCGDYSTPLIHALRGNRPAFSYESDAAWCDRFKDLRCDGHTITHVTDWTEVDIAGPWGVAFVDHIGELRPNAIRALKDHASVVLAHDTDASVYGWGDCFDGYDWVWTHAREETWVTLAGTGWRPEWVTRLLIPGMDGPPKQWR